MPVQLKDALPVFEIFKVWPDGVAPPETPLKVKVVGDRTMWAARALTVMPVPVREQFGALVGV